MRHLSLGLALNGDGRLRVRSSPLYDDVTPSYLGERGITLASARRLIREFQETGVYYSGGGGLMWVHEEWCKLTRQRYFSSLAPAPMGGIVTVHEGKFEEWTQRMKELRVP